MTIPVTFAHADGSDRFPVAVRVVRRAAPAQILTARLSSIIAPGRIVPGDHYRPRMIGVPQRLPFRGTRLRLEQRRLDVLRLSLQ